jgi:hypothetical protein
MVVLVIMDFLVNVFAQFHVNLHLKVPFLS